MESLSRNCTTLDEKETGSWTEETSVLTLRLPVPNRVLVLIRAVFIPILFFFVSTCAVPPDRTAALNPDPSLLYATHGQPGEWFNPWRPSNKRFTDLFRWAISKSAYTGEWRDPPDVGRVANDGSSFAMSENSASVTWVGHSTFVVHDDADVFLTDPHFGKRALIPGPSPSTRCADHVNSRPRLCRGLPQSLRPS